MLGVVIENILEEGETGRHNAFDRRVAVNRNKEQTKTWHREDPDVPT